MFTGYIPGVHGYWGTLGNCFLFHILSWLFPASRAAASSDRGAGLPRSPAFFRLTPRGKHPGKTNSELYSTPLRTEVTTIHFSCHRVEAQPVTPSSLGPSGFAGSGGWGQRGWCSHPCRRRLGTCFCRNYRKRWCPHTWPSSACLTSVTQEVVLLFWPSFHHLDSFPTPGQCTVPLPPCERISFLSITNIGLIAYLRKKKTHELSPSKFGGFSLWLGFVVLQ